MEIPIWGWCIIVAGIIMVTVLCNLLDRWCSKPLEIEEDGKASSSVTLEKKDPVKEDGKSKTNEKAQAKPNNNLV
ncbi:hypothetical protein AtNW77_Chr1g0010001 [Arabidopsis thaliana]|uniref:Transmembrane protein n=5 Tax=Arabidopsis TaxID=3701 RepID=Q1G3V0_ARATH|nr:uncharacterized protein AT1G09625 [Arabidopsis thaliana]KAG7596441.1 hypothetical protein ISN44_As06g008980 [Arabidopsis suecica]KAG7645701.1 hypothetical protein ISN45_At01g009210 [Arabidopsis thaliana x Arabidopsis arenosa]ABF59199.1 unknown protein [Arabidopsis thaliana]AEE28470.1 transmembrane protein [Arabidopsis thaliana]VYS45539.1 unnamed protein product [Arabidopsis thaliana]|eukprot:NP_001077497.1 transmembrane protein [Arabidopsis thaliana]